jgi:acyl-CoA-binding protein
MSEFEKAQTDVHTLSKKPGNEHLLVLYAHFKQAIDGDVHGTRPGLLHPTKRLKYDAWTKLKGMSREAAEAGYIAKVKSLLKADGKL